MLRPTLPHLLQLRFRVLRLALLCLGVIAAVAWAPTPAAADGTVVETEEQAKKRASYRYVHMTAKEAYAELDRRGVPYVLVKKRMSGVLAPIRLTGALHGVHIHSSLPEKKRATSAFEILDARLALALDDFTAVLERHGIVELVHYTMYRPNGLKPGSKADAAAKKSQKKAQKKSQKKAQKKPRKKKSSRKPKSKRGKKKALGKGKKSRKRRGAKGGKRRSQSKQKTLRKKKTTSRGRTGATTKPSKKGSKKSSKKRSSKRGAKKSAKKASKKGSKRSAKKGSKKGSKRSAKKSSKRSAKKGNAAKKKATPVKQVAYSPPGTRHPAGLAIDVGGFRKRDGRWLGIAQHFGGKIGKTTCGPGASPANTTESRELWSIACESVELGIFTYVFTPNYDKPHFDHFHMEIRPNVTWHMVK